MNWVHIDRILAKCTKRPGAKLVPSDMGVGDYSELLSKYNGIEGFIGPEQYLVLWTVNQIHELNVAYRVADFVPGLTLFGTDGSDTGFGCEAATGRYVAVPLVGMSVGAIRDVGSSLEEFLSTLAGN